MLRGEKDFGYLLGSWLSWKTFKFFILAFYMQLLACSYRHVAADILLQICGSSHVAAYLWLQTCSSKDSWRISNVLSILFIIKRVVVLMVVFLLHLFILLYFNRSSLHKQLKIYKYKLQLCVVTMLLKVTKYRVMQLFI